MNRLAEILLNKSLDDCSIGELQSITQKYPFFNAGHLLAVQKLQKIDSENLSASIQKANLHFQSIYINQALSEKGDAEVIAGASTPVKEQVGVYDEEANKLEAVSPDENNEIKENAIADLPTEDLVPHEDHTSDFRAKPDGDDQQIITNEEQVVALPEKQDTEFDNLPSSHNDEVTIPHEQTVTTSEQQESSIGEQETSNQQPATSDPQLAFHPYHTVDYFASQGIKVKLDENPTDKFSRQLKSFTEWLKTLKKLPDNEKVPVTNTTVEKKVDQLAEVSLTDSNVVTEAMAEVWAKQGNHQKAIEIYNKLSLLEPSKSTYFASLIEDLKKASL